MALSRGAGVNIWTCSGRAGARAPFVLAAAIAGLAASARAQADEPVAQVVVHGTTASGFSSRASLDDQPRQIADVAELLEPIAGIHVRRQGGEDSFATLSIRGTSSSEVAVVLAGVPLTGGADPSLDLASLPLWPGAQARVYRSFAPASLGPGSLGGTLALDAPSPHDPERSEVWVGAGSFGAARLRIGDIREMPGGGRIALGLSASRATDDFSYFLPFDGQLTTQQNAEHASGQALVAYSLPFVLGHRDGELSVTTLVQARRQHLPGNFDLVTPYQVLASDRELGSVQMSIAAGPGAAYARVWGRRDDLHLTDDAITARLQQGASNEDDAILATGGAIGWRGAPVRAVHLDIQGDASGERFAPGEFSGATAPPGVTRASIGAGGDATWNVTSRWTLAATARADFWNDVVDGAVGSEDAQHAEFHPTGHLGSEVALGPVTLAAHGGALARPPSFLERYGDRGTFVGNPSLVSESAWTVDAGGRVAGKSAHGLLTGQMDISGFATWADDLITFVAYGSGRERATNIGRARMVGLEVAGNGTAGPFFGRVAWTEMATTNLAGCDGAASGIVVNGTCARPPLPGRPALDLVTDAGILAGPLRLRYGVDLTSGQYADDAGAIHVPARILQSTGAALDIPRVPGLRLSADIRNLFDVRTATYEGFAGPVREPIGDAYLYPLPGRSIFASLRYVPLR